MNQLQLKFGSYCQVAEDVTPRNSLAARTRGAISMGPSGNLFGGQNFGYWQACCQKSLEGTTHDFGRYRPCQFARSY